MLAHLKMVYVQESLFCLQLGSGDALTPVIDASASGLGCLHFNVLQYFTADEAIAFCQGRGTGGRLVEVLSQEQQDVLVEAINQVDQRTWWNGATRQGDQWVWRFSDEPVGDFGWGPGFPSDDPEHRCAFHYYGAPHYSTTLLLAELVMLGRMSAATTAILLFVRLTTTRRLTSSQ